MHDGAMPGPRGPRPAHGARAARRRTSVARRSVGAALAAATALALSGCGLLPWSLPTPSGPVTSSSAATSAAPSSTPAPSTTAAPAPGWVRPSEVRVGACVDTANGRHFPTFKVVDCGQMHDGQVVAQGVIGGTSLPDEDDEAAWDRLFERQCIPAFEEFTGTAWDDSRLSMFTWAPTDDDFAAGGRTLTCVIQMFDGTRFSGSALGKNNEDQFEHDPRWRAPTEEDLFGEEETHRV